MLLLLPLKRYFQFSGRSGRAEYWQFIAAYILILVVCSVLDAANTPLYGTNNQICTLIAFVALIVPVYTVTFRRLHDRRLSGWLLALQVAAGFIAGFGHGGFSEARGTAFGIPFLLLELAGGLASAALAIYLVWQCCLTGDPLPNRFGPPPTDTGENAPQFDRVMAGMSERARRFAGSTTTTESDRLRQLERLATLHQAGALTDDEFAQQKTMLLER